MVPTPPRVSGLRRPQAATSRVFRVGHLLGRGLPSANRAAEGAFEHRHHRPRRASPGWIRSHPFGHGYARSAKLQQNHCVGIGGLRRPFARTASGPNIGVRNPNTTGCARRSDVRPRARRHVTSVRRPRREGRTVRPRRRRVAVALQLSPARHVRTSQIPGTTGRDCDAWGGNAAKFRDCSAARWRVPLRTAVVRGEMSAPGQCDTSLLPNEGDGGAGRRRRRRVPQMPDGPVRIKNWDRDGVGGAEEDRRDPRMAGSGHFQGESSRIQPRRRDAVPPPTARYWPSPVEHRPNRPTFRGSGLGASRRVPPFRLPRPGQTMSGGTALARRTASARDSKGAWRARKEGFAPHVGCASGGVCVRGTRPSLARQTPPREPLTAHRTARRAAERSLGLAARLRRGMTLAHGEPDRLAVQLGCRRVCSASQGTINGAVIDGGHGGPRAVGGGLAAEPATTAPEERGENNDRFRDNVQGGRDQRQAEMTAPASTTPSEGHSREGRPWRWAAAVCRCNTHKKRPSVIPPYGPTTRPAPRPGTVIAASAD